MKKLILLSLISLSITSYGQTDSTDANEYASSFSQKDLFNEGVTPENLSSDQYGKKLDSIKGNNIVALEFKITSSTGNFTQDELDRLEDQYGEEIPNPGNLDLEVERRYYNHTWESTSVKFIIYNVEVINESGKTLYKLSLLVGEEMGL